MVLFLCSLCCLLFGCDPQDSARNFQQMLDFRCAMHSLEDSSIVEVAMIRFREKPELTLSTPIWMHAVTGTTGSALVRASAQSRFGAARSPRSLSNVV